MKLRKGIKKNLFGKRYLAEPSPFSVGGMGEVYIGLDTRLNRQVVIKVIKNEFSESIRYRRRFKREAKLMALLNHNNIVKIFDFDARTEVWIAMEFLNGATMDCVSLPVSVPRLLSFFRQMASALNYCHENNIAHCDIKPANIIEEKGRFVLIDFGISYRAMTENGDADLERTKVRDAGGTSHYAPPEQTAGNPTTASDVYSLGVTMYELATGDRPFQVPKHANTSQSSVILAQAHMTKVRPHPSIKRPGLPRYMGDLIVQCMSINESDRPAPLDITARLSNHSTLEIKEQTSIFIDKNFEATFDLVAQLVKRYTISESPNEAEVAVSSRISFLERSTAQKKILVVRYDDPDAVIETAALSGFNVLVGPVTLTELISEIEK